MHWGIFFRERVFKSGRTVYRSAFGGRAGSSIRDVGHSGDDCVKAFKSREAIGQALNYLSIYMDTCAHVYIFIKREGEADSLYFAGRGDTFAVSYAKPALSTAPLSILCGVHTYVYTYVCIYTYAYIYKGKWH